jgi:hypothetical protein
MVGRNIISPDGSVSRLASFIFVEELKPKNNTVAATAALKNTIRCNFMN